MPTITLAQAEAKLTAYLAAEEKILLRQAADLNGRSLTFADLRAVQAGVSLWQLRVDRLSRTGGLKTRQVVPL